MDSVSWLLSPLFHAGVSSVAKSGGIMSLKSGAAPVDAVLHVQCQVSIKGHSLTLFDVKLVQGKATKHQNGHALSGGLTWGSCLRCKIMPSHLRAPKLELFHNTIGELVWCRAVRIEAVIVGCVTDSPGPARTDGDDEPTQPPPRRLRGQNQSSDLVRLVLRRVARCVPSRVRDR